MQIAVQVDLMPRFDISRSVEHPPTMITVGSGWLWH